MTKRNLFTTLAAIFVSAAFFVGCDHALSQQTASVTFSIPADVIMAMTKDARPASEAEIAKMARAASRQAAGADGAYATLTVSLSEHAAPQTRFFTEEEFNAIQSGASAIAPFDFTGLPVGARVTVTAALLLTDGMYYEDSAEVALAAGPNSVSLTMRAKTRRLALVAATRETGKQLAQGDTVTFSHEDGNAVIHLTVTPADGVTYGDGNTPMGADGVTGSGSITLRFNNVTTSGNPSYTVTARATRNDPTYVDSTAVFTYTVQGDALNQVTVSPPRSDVALIRGVNSSVTFSHGDNAATIHLRVTSTATSTAATAFTVISGGTASGENVTGAMGQPVALDFTAAGGYTVTAWATRDGYANSSEAPFPYTVVNPKLEGKVEANQQSGTLTMVEGEIAVTFTYANAAVPDASIVLEGLPNSGVSVTSNGKPLTPSSGQVTGEAGQSVTVTFTAEGNYNNITAYAEKADYEKSDDITVSYNVQRPQLGVVTMSRSVSASATIASGSTVTLTRNDVVTFSYASTDGVRDAQIVVSGLPDSGVTVMSGNLQLSGTTVTGAAGQTVVVRFTAANANGGTITARATRAHHTDSPNATFSYTVVNPKLSGTISAQPSGGTLTRGQTVTFTYTGDNTGVANNVTIHLPFNDVAGVTVTGGSTNQNEITGTGGSVTLTFNPTDDNKTYTIKGAYASLTDYQNSNTADFNYTVDFPQLSGTFTATPSGSTTSAWQSGGTVNTLARGDTVTFRYANTDTSVIDARIVVSGLPNGATATSNGQNLVLSDGTVTGAAGQSVTVTFGSTTNSNSTITVKATKQYYREATGTSYVCKVDDPKLTGTFIASKNTGGNLTEGDNTANPNTLTRGESVTFSYTNTNSPTVTDAQIVLSGLTGSGFDVRNGTATSGATITRSSDGTYKGSGTSVTVTFNSSVTAASTISVKATKADYQDTTETRYAYTVQNPPLSGGSFSASVTSGDTIPTNSSVVFTYTNVSVTGARIVLGGLSGTGFTVRDGSNSGTVINASADGTYKGSGQSVTVTFSGAGNYTITPSAEKTDYQAQTGTTSYSYTVADFTIGSTLTTSTGGALPMSTYGGNPNTYLVGTDVSTLQISLRAGNSGYTGNVTWSVMADSNMITPTSAGGGNWNLPLGDLATGVHTLTVSRATVNGVSVGAAQTFNILKFGNSGNLALSGNVAITNGSLTIAPTSNITINAPASGAAFTVSSGGTLTLGGGTGTVTIDGSNTSRSYALVSVSSGTLNIGNNATLQNNNRTSGNGGGLEVTGGNVNMTGGMISENNAQYGGGVYVGSGGRFTMSGGTISNNWATNGCGIYVASGTFDFNYDPNTANTAISGNITTSGQGQDVYVKAGVNYTNPYRRQQTVGTDITTMEELTLGGATPGI